MVKFVTLIGTKRAQGMISEAALWCVGDGFL